MNDLLALPESPADEASSADFPDYLGRLFDLHHDRLFRLARRMGAVREEARDLTQETFLRAARRPASVPGPEAAEAWLVQVMVNLCRDQRRRAVVRREKAPPVTDAVRSPEGAVVARATLQAALAKLPARRRAVVALNELEGRPTAEVARLLGVSAATVRWHRAAALRSLGELLIEEDEG